MAIIEAFKRTKKTTHNYGGRDYVFDRNESGHVVCDVHESEAVERFLSISTAFRIYALQKAAPLQRVAEHEKVMSPVMSPVEPGSSKTDEKIVQEAKVAALPTVDVTRPAPPDQTAPPDGERARFVLKHGEQTMDLNPMSDEALHHFAKANGVRVHPNAKGDTIREKIVEHFTAPAKA